MNNLIKENENLIYSIINKYKNYNDIDDLFQVGAIGLLNAYKNYKDDQNTKFSSYAYFYIKGEVVKYIRENRLIKTSAELIKLNTSIQKAKNFLRQKYCKEPSTQELALFLEVDENIIDEAVSINNFNESLDYEYDENINLYNKISYEEKNLKEELIDLRNELNNLNPFEKQLINERYMNGLTQSETSESLGISQVQVCRKEKEILVRLRTKLE